jgi:hypothetical protein
MEPSGSPARCDATGRRPRTRGPTITCSSRRSLPSCAKPDWSPFTSMTLVGWLVGWFGSRLRRHDHQSHRPAPPRSGSPTPATPACRASRRSPRAYPIVVDPATFPSREDAGPAGEYSDGVTEARKAIDAMDGTAPGWQAERQIVALKKEERTLGQRLAMLRHALHGLASPAAHGDDVAAEIKWDRELH